MVLIRSPPKNSPANTRSPWQAALETLEYVAQNRSLIEQERDHEAARLHARGLDGPTQG